jgi:hypothetical protein
MNAKRSVDKGWSLTVRRLVTVWLVWHFTALVFAAGAAPPSADVVQRGWQWFRFYLQPLYLNHAYRFYSPEPGPTMLMRYTLTMPDGSTVDERTFPERSDYGPRLRYQRHLALANALFGEKEAAQRLAQSYAWHLLDATGAETIEISRVAHRPMSMSDALRGADPRDEVFYLPPDRLGRMTWDWSTNGQTWEGDLQPAPGTVGPE